MAKKKKLNTDVYRIELTRIKQKYKKLTASIVVKEAKNDKSPLHKCFDWDNKSAAQKWRLSQARNLIDSVTEVVIIDGKHTKQRSFYNVKTPSQDRIWVTLTEATKKTSYRKQLLDKIITHLENTTYLMKMFQKGKR
jgi:hypothetical protein